MPKLTQQQKDERAAAKAAKAERAEQKKAAKEAEKKAKAEARAAAKAAKDAEKRKKQFQKTRSVLDNALCREIRYYQKEAEKAIFKCPVPNNR